MWADMAGSPRRWWATLQSLCSSSEERRSPFSYGNPGTKTWTGWHKPEVSTKRQACLSSFSQFENWWLCCFQHSVVPSGMELSWVHAGLSEVLLTSVSSGCRFPFFSTRLEVTNKLDSLTRMKTAAAKGTAPFGAYEKGQLPECLMAVLSSLVSSVQSRVAVSPEITRRWVSSWVMPHLCTFAAWRVKKVPLTGWMGWMCLCGILLLFRSLFQITVLEVA